MFDNFIDMAKDIQNCAMLEFESICENVADKSEELTDEEKLKFQTILDEAQRIFESRHK